MDVAKKIGERIAAILDSALPDKDKLFALRDLSQKLRAIND